MRRIKLAAGLQSLIQQLSSPTAGSAGSAANPSQAALQQSFASLLSVNGSSGSTSSLANFLQTMSQDLQGTSSTGIVANTKA